MTQPINKKKFFPFFEKLQNIGLREGERDGFLEIQQGNLLNKLLSPDVSMTVENTTPVRQTFHSWEDSEAVFLSDDYESLPEFNASAEVAKSIESEYWAPVVSSEITANPMSRGEILSKEINERKEKVKKVAKVAGGVGLVWLLLL